MRQGMTQGRTFLKVPQDHTKSDGSLKYISWLLLLLQLIPVNTGHPIPQTRVY
jgi:predicted ATPase